MRMHPQIVLFLVFGTLLLGHFVAAGAEPGPKAKKPADDAAQAVIDEVEKECLRESVPMVGRPKAERLAELVRKAKPQRIVECGTALGYSGLWMARELKKTGRGRLITIEIDPKTAKRAEDNFRRAGLADYVTVKVGDARNVVKTLEGPIDFLFLDCGYSNYHPCFVALEEKLRPGTTVVADNVGIDSAGSMNDYLKLVRGKYQSRTEWFDVNLPWAKRDAMEVTVLKK